MWVIGTERRPTDDRLIHDRPKRPPVAAESITLAAEDFRGNVVRRTDGGICHSATRLAPIVDLSTVADRKIDLIKIDRITIISPTRGMASQEVLIVRCLMLLVEPRREAKVGKLEMASLIQQNVVGFDITMGRLAFVLKRFEYGTTTATIC